MQSGLNDSTIYLEMAVGRSYDAFAGLRSRSGGMGGVPPISLSPVPGVGHWPTGSALKGEKVGLRGYSSSSPGFAARAPSPREKYTLDMVGIEISQMIRAKSEVV